MDAAEVESLGACATVREHKRGTSLNTDVTIVVGQVNLPPADMCYATRLSHILLDMSTVVSSSDLKPHSPSPHSRWECCGLRG